MSFHSGGIELSVEAQDDLAEISAYGIEEWGEAESLQYYSELLHTFDRIERFPLIGQRVDVNQTALYRLLCKAHVIYYRLNEAGETTEIVRVLHARMEADRHLDRS